MSMLVEALVGSWLAVEAAAAVGEGHNILGCTHRRHNTGQGMVPQVNSQRMNMVVSREIQRRIRGL
jgi:hypothetical protein